METPSRVEADAFPELSKLLDTAEPDDIEFMLQDPYTFDESQFPDLVHIPVSKLGGWPTWVQDAEWPRDHPKEDLTFVAQLSALGHDRETWCEGMLYLFVHPANRGNRKAKMLLQCG